MNLRYVQPLRRWVLIVSGYLPPAIAARVWNYYWPEARPREAEMKCPNSSGWRSSFDS